MGHDPDRMKECPDCGTRGELDEQEKVPGGFDWYNYDCPNCGNSWRT